MKQRIAATLLTIALPVLAANAAAATNAPERRAALTADPVILAQADMTMTDGEVRKVDKENKKITLKHGEIKNLSMPGMTMIFQVKEPAMLDQVKVGDKVRFHAEQVNGAVVVTGIEPAK